MNSGKIDATVLETDMLRKENEALKERLARLSDATVSISDNRETESVLQEVINSV